VRDLAELAALEAQDAEADAEEEQEEERVSWALAAGSDTNTDLAEFALSQREVLWCLYA
jgi:hypothetical protein